MILGRVQLQRWLQILLYANHGKSNTITSPLLMLASTRGKLLELMAQKLKPGNRSVADKSFTVGIMSLMDALFGQPMEKILEQIAVAEEVRDALLFRKGTYGDMLKLAEYVERIEDAGPLLLPTLEKLKLSPEDFSALQLTAFQWASNIGSGSK
jgi:c-di-GMP phosphodiesterase